VYQIISNVLALARTFLIKRFISFSLSFIALLQGSPDGLSLFLVLCLKNSYGLLLPQFYGVQQGKRGLRAVAYGVRLSPPIQNCHSYHSITEQL